MNKSWLHITSLIMLLLVKQAIGQDTPYSNPSFESAYALAYEGKTNTAHNILYTLINEPETEEETSILWARTLSWRGDYDGARSAFNSILSKNKNNRAAWLGAIKNELYAKNYHTAHGIVNKALLHKSNDPELQRLRAIAIDGINGIVYSDKAWYNVDSKIARSSSKPKKETAKVAERDTLQNVHKTPVTEEQLKNTVSVNSSVTFYDKRFYSFTTSSIS